MAHAKEGYGITITFASGFLAEIVDVPTLPGFNRKWIDTTHTQSPSNRMEGQPSDLVKVKPLKVTIHHDPSATPPIDDAIETITITFPLFEGESTHATFACDGAMVDYDPKGPLDDKMVADVEIEFTGLETITAAT